MNEISRIQNEFGNYLFNFIRSRVPSTEDAEDIYHEVMYKIIRRREQIHKTESLKSWLFTVAKNQVMDFYRSRKSSVELEGLGEIAFDENKADAYGELEKCLGGFIRLLPEDYREVIQLSEIEGKSQKEVAQKLGLNYVTLRSKVQRGREKIRKLIMEACQIEKDGAGRVVECRPNTGGGCG